MATARPIIAGTNVHTFIGTPASRNAGSMNIDGGRPGEDDGDCRKEAASRLRALPLTPDLGFLIASRKLLRGFAA
jgi:hypothetical protein